MSIEIVESSPIAQRLSESIARASKYPFDELEIGKSFTAKIDGVNWQSLRICVYQHNARDKTKVFKFIKHDELGICEVARIA